MSNKKRYFTLVDFPTEGKTTGRYSGKTPKNAGSKAFSRLCKEFKYGNSTGPFNYIEFTIKETTQGSDHKNYRFYGTRSKLYKPIVVNYNGTMREHHYKNIITKCKD